MHLLWVYENIVVSQGFNILGSELLTGFIHKGVNTIIEEKYVYKIVSL